MDGPREAGIGRGVPTRGRTTREMQWLEGCLDWIGRFSSTEFPGCGGGADATVLTREAWSALVWNTFLVFANHNLSFGDHNLSFGITT